MFRSRSLFLLSAFRISALPDTPFAICDWPLAIREAGGPWSPSDLSAFQLFPSLYPLAFSTQPFWLTFRQPQPFYVAADYRPPHPEPPAA